MSKYVVSDIHGCYGEFIKMMNLIKYFKSFYYILI